MIGSIVTIAVSGIVAAFAAWFAVHALDLHGVLAGLVAVVIAMPLGLATFALVVRLFRRTPE